MCQKGRKLNGHGIFINNPLEQGTCLICNKNLQSKRPELNSKGETTYRGTCQTCRNTRIDYSKKEGSKYIYRQHKKDCCEKCGFVPQHKCQLDVDHINGIHEDNDPSNLQTLCANCHRLKTWQDKNIETLERVKLVEEYDKQQKDIKESLEKTDRYRRSIKGIQYIFYMKQNATEDEIKKFMTKGIADGSIIGEVRRKSKHN